MLYYGVFLQHEKKEEVLNIWNWELTSKVSGYASHVELMNSTIQVGPKFFEQIMHLGCWAFSKIVQFVRLLLSNVQLANRTLRRISSGSCWCLALVRADRKYVGVRAVGSKFYIVFVEEQPTIMFIMVEHFVE